MRSRDTHPSLTAVAPERSIGLDTAGTTAELRAKHKQESSLLQHGVDYLTALVGLPGFVVVLTIAIILWIAGNMLVSSFGLWSIDPPPFVWLQGAISMGALYVATLILSTQRREDKLVGEREQLLLELAILSDKKSSKIIELLQELRRDNPEITDRIDNEARDMSQPSDHHSVMSAIKNA